MPKGTWVDSPSIGGIHGGNPGVKPGTNVGRGSFSEVGTARFPSSSEYLSGQQGNNSVGFHLKNLTPRAIGRFVWLLVLPRE
jgi:hypothetical protein